MADKKNSMVQQPKGLIRFFYVWANWERISEELKSRDERPRDVERVMRQIHRLEKESSEVEKRRLEESYRTSLTELGRDFVDVMLALSILLYLEKVPEVRHGVLARLRPQLREILSVPRLGSARDEPSRA